MGSGDGGRDEKPRRPPLIRVNVLDQGGFGRRVMAHGAGRGLGGWSMSRFSACGWSIGGWDDLMRAW